MEHSCSECQNRFKAFMFLISYDIASARVLITRLNFTRPFSVDRKFLLNSAVDQMQLIKTFINIRQIWAVDRNFYQYLAVDQNLFKAKNAIIRTFDLLPKFASYFLAQG